MMNNEEIDAFTALVDRSKGGDSCWEWRGHRNKDGYGRTRHGPAHRVSWTLKNGQIPEGLIVRHKCDNPSCCNPAHLLLGAHADNVRDRVQRNRTAKHERHGRAKLTKRQVRMIRSGFDGWMHKEIAKKFGVSRSVVTRILNGQGWSGVE
jgi:hypothetical protein